MPEAEIAGKYEPLRKLAMGGMAEVFLARQKGVEGFEKLVVLKRILPHLAGESQFVDMFLDEARTAADLRHPNVVTVFEVGESNGTWFMAMEYLHGQNLRRVDRAAAENGGSIPMPHALRVIVEAAHGLHYAHTKVDLRGKPLGIIHRDVSPHNLLVTYDGVTKVLDFGIAKAAGKSTETASGVVRGKVAYMSPEQVIGGELDARSDQFSLGIVLWEITTGQRLFNKATDLLTMQAVADGDVPKPTQVFPAYPKDLEEIVLTALAPKREKRFASCLALAEALEEFLARHSLVHSASRLATYLRGLFPAESTREPLAVAGQVEPTMAPEQAAKTNAVAEPPPIPPTGKQPVEVANTPLPAGSITGWLLAAVRDRRTNLSADPGSFVGRAADLQALKEAFGAKGERLVTLKGPGGAGKTRLARRFGAMHLQDTARTASSVWFLDLTEARNAEGICTVVGGVLGLTLASGRLADTVQQIGQSLAGRGAALLILDNFEQVVEHAEATLGRWLELSPQTQALVTSRELLGLPGETVYELDALSAADGLQLFVTRAKAARRDWILTAEDEPIVAEIVKRLEGMPLAIELAAARIGVLPPAKLLERLTKKLDVLAAGKGGPTRRHSTLRQTIEWSWNLLSPWEQDALEQCAVFHGGFPLDAAESVLDLKAQDGALPVLDVIQSLRAKSLLRTWEPDELRGELRFGMYSNIADFAAEKLFASGHRVDVETRADEWFLGQGAAWAEDCDGPHALDRIHRLATEMENLLAVLHRALAAAPTTRDTATRALMALKILDPVLGTRGPFETYLTWLDAALSAAETVDVPPELLAKVAEQRGWLQRRRGEGEAALADLARALAWAKQAEDRAEEGRVLARIGSTQFFLGRRQDGIDSLERARDQLHAVDKAGEARALLHLGDAYSAMHREEDARASYVRALGLERERHNRRGEAMLLRGLGRLVWGEGKLEEARECQERALPIAREFGDRELEGAVLGTLAGICHEQGRFEDARAHYTEAIDVHGQLGKRYAQARWLGNLGILEHEQGHTREAAACYDGAAEWSRATGHRGAEGLFLAYLGAVRADLDDLVGARRSFASATKLLASEGDELASAAVAVLEGHVDVAQSRQQLKDGKDADAERAQQAAMNRILAAQARGDGSGPSPAERSEDVRHAVRLLRTRIQSAMGTALKMRRARKPA